MADAYSINLTDFDLALERWRDRRTNQEDNGTAQELFLATFPFEDLLELAYQGRRRFKQEPILAITTGPKKETER